MLIGTIKYSRHEQDDAGPPLYLIDGCRDIDIDIDIDRDRDLVRHHRRHHEQEDAGQPLEGGTADAHRGPRAGCGERGREREGE